MRPMPPPADAAVSSETLVARPRKAAALKLNEALLASPERFFNR